MNVHVCQRCINKPSQKENLQSNSCDECVTKNTTNQEPSSAPISKQQEEKKYQNSPVDDNVTKKVCIQNSQEQKVPQKQPQEDFESQPKIDFRSLTLYTQVNKEQPNEVSQIEVIEEPEFEGKFKYLVSSGENLVVLGQDTGTSKHFQFLFTRLFLIPYGQRILGFKRAGHLVMIHLQDQTFVLLRLRTLTSEKFKGQLLERLSYQIFSTFRDVISLPNEKEDEKMALEGTISRGKVMDFRFGKLSQLQQRKQENLQENIDFTNGQIKISNNSVEIRKQDPQTGQLFLLKVFQGKISKFKTAQDLYIFIHSLYQLNVLVVQQNGQLIQTQKYGVSAVEIFQQANKIQLYFGTKEGMLGFAQINKQ